MPGPLAEACVAVLGGDLRQLAVAEAMAAAASTVRIYGLPHFPRVQGVAVAASLDEALAGARVVILPIGRIGSDGRISTLPEQPLIKVDEVFWRLLAPGALLAAGSVAPEVRYAAEAAGYRVLEYAEIDEIAVLNSIPTAEGALQLAMEALPITIHGCSCFILGLGRVGLTTARLFRAVGADTWVVANRPALRARAYEMGCRHIAFADLPKEIGRADLVINTVPAPVVPEHILRLTKPSVCLVDLASAPGGVDHEAAKALDRRSILALGLPGKVALETAGRILAATLPAKIAQELG